MMGRVFPRMKVVTPGTTLQLFWKRAYVVLTAILSLSSCTPFRSAVAAPAELWQRRSSTYTPETLWQENLMNDGGNEKGRESSSVDNRLQDIIENPLTSGVEEILLPEAAVAPGPTNEPGETEVQGQYEVESGRKRWPKFLQRAARWFEGKKIGERAGRLATKIRQTKWTEKLKEVLKNEEVRTKLLDLAAAAAVMSVGTILSKKGGSIQQILGSAFFLTGTINAATALAGIARGALKQKNSSQTAKQTRGWFGLGRSSPTPKEGEESSVELQ